jgi:transcriptional regulator with XRE-family HTH domain
MGKIGTPRRDLFEYELQMELIRRAIKRTREEHNMTQEAFGELAGVEKKQISRIERNPQKATMDALMSVLRTLKAKINFQVELPSVNLSLVN